jgi:signal transduction histidine kinase
MHPEYIIDIEFDLGVNQNFLVVEGDDQLLQVAMTNLMDNGCKYSNNDTVVASLFSDNNKTISIQFLNSGDGIQTAELDQIFNPFYRGSNRRKTKGFGIGLSLSEKIIKLHEGRMFVESKPHEFTKFVVELPIALS